jgi:hypothetical protein
MGGMFATGATITTPGAEPRELNEAQATAFMQTWLLFSIVSNPPQERPPADATRSEVQVMTKDPAGVPGGMLIYFATKGTEAWVGAPNHEASKENWIRAPKPADSIAAFNGGLEPTCPHAVAPETTSTTAAEPPSNTAQNRTSDTAGNDTGVWIAGGSAIGVGLLTVGLLRRRRRATK